MRKLIITEDEKTRIIGLHQFKKFLTEASEHSENLFKSWANKKSGNPELALSLMNDFFNLQNKLPKKDFSQYKNAEELKSYIDKIKSQSKKPEEDVDVIYKDNNLLVVATKTWEAGCKYGSGTKWCTSSKDESSYWSRHNSSGTEFIWITKNLPQNNPLYKVSLHFKENASNNRKSHDWCNAINDCGYDNPFKKNNINISNFDEIFNKCYEYHYKRFEVKIKDREEKRKNITSQPVYIQSIEYLNGLLNDISNNDDILDYLVSSITSIFEEQDEMITPIYELDNESYQTFVGFIHDSCKDWLSSPQTIVNTLNDTLTNYVFDMINNDPFVDFDSIKNKIDTEIIEILSETVFYDVKNKIIRKLPGYLDIDFSNVNMDLLDLL
jgi:hypothetical protein